MVVILGVGGRFKLDVLARPPLLLRKSGHLFWRVRRPKRRMFSTPDEDPRVFPASAISGYLAERLALRQRRVRSVCYCRSRAYD